jgi:Tfp pilus assembly protein PilF
MPMNLRKAFVLAAAFILGGIAGFSVAWTLQEQGGKSMAKASIYASGEALRSGDLVMSMLYAQSAIHHAPKAYAGYEAVGDVYSKQGDRNGALKMYEFAVETLNSGGSTAVLIGQGSNDVANATALLRRKIDALR